MKMTVNIAMFVKDTLHGIGADLSKPIGFRSWILYRKIDLMASRSAVRTAATASR